MNCFNCNKPICNKKARKGCSCGISYWFYITGNIKDLHYYFNFYTISYYFDTNIMSVYNVKLHKVYKFNFKSPPSFKIKNLKKIIDKLSKSEIIS